MNLKIKYLRNISKFGTAFVYSVEKKHYKDMKRLVCKENPKIYIVAPDENICEVGGNCWQVTGPQPMTYAKCFWDLKDMPDHEKKIKELEKKVSDAGWQYEYDHADDWRKPTEMGQL